MRKRVVAPGVPQVICSAFVFCVLALLLGLPAAAPSAPLRVQAPQAGAQVLLRVAPGVSSLEVRQLASSHQATLVRALRRPGQSRGRTVYCLRSASQSGRALAASLGDDPRVVAAFPDAVITADATYPDDASFKSQWGMYRIAAPLAWDLTTGLTGTSAPVVAVIDSGVSYTHVDLAANMWTNSGETAGNGLDDDGNGYVDDVHGIDAFNHDGDPLDDHYHGTHTSGIAGAVGNNGIGVAGVSWSVRIMALKALGANLVGTNSAALECVNYAIDQKVNHGVNVVAINASWGGAPYPEDSALREAIAAAGRAGIVWCASAGNDGLDNDAQPRFPSSYDVATILAVAASDSSDLLPAWSNYGATSVDLAAPGVNVLSTRSGDSYTWLGGTSQAAPHVAGTVALCAALFPDETALQRVDRVLTGVDQLPAFDGKVASGGRLDAFQSLTADLRPTTEVLGLGEGWHTSPVEVQLRASDGTGIGVDRTEYGLDGAALTTGDTVTVAEDGAHALSYRSVDKAGNEESVKSAAVWVDATAPEVTGLGAGDGWLNGPTTVRLGVADATSGLATWRYALDGGAWEQPETAAADVAVSGDGVHSIVVEAADLAGNSSVEAYGVRIDAVAPVATIQGADAAWHNAPVLLSLSAVDEASGVARTEYALNGAAWTPSAQVLVTAQGVNTVGYRAVDVAGNVGATKSVQVKVDSVAPTTLGLTSGGQRNRTVSLYYRVNDALPTCGQAVVSDLVVKNAKGATVRRFSNLGTVSVNQTLSCTFVCNLVPGAYRFTVSARDIAGSAATTTTAGTLVVKK